MVRRLFTGRKHIMNGTQIFIVWLAAIAGGTGSLIAWAKAWRSQWEDEKDS